MANKQKKLSLRHRLFCTVCVLLYALLLYVFHALGNKMKRDSFFTCATKRQSYPALKRRNNKQISLDTQQQLQTPRIKAHK